MSRRPTQVEVVFVEEPVAPLLAEGLEDLIVFHWEEVEQDREAVPLAVDWPKILMLERMGGYRAVTARRAGRLVGYASYYLQPLIDHSTTLAALNHTLYLDPDVRKGRIGNRFIAAAEGFMRARGARLITQGDRKITANSTGTAAHATLGDLLLRDGYRLAEKVYVKLL